MGEARRRADQGLPPRKQPKSKTDTSPRVVPWLPITQNQRLKFYSLTRTGSWIGIGVLAFVWIIVRFIGPAAGWWTPADAP